MKGSEKTAFICRTEKTKLEIFFKTPIMSFFFFFNLFVHYFWGFPGDSVGKNPANARDAGLIPGLGRFPGEGNGNPLQILAWEIPWTGEPGGLQSSVRQTAGHN